LASPLLVIAYALAGRIDIDFEKEPLSQDTDGNDVYLRDIWPTRKEIQTVEDKHVIPEMFSKVRKNNPENFLKKKFFFWGKTDLVTCKKTPKI